MSKTENKASIEAAKLIVRSEGARTLVEELLGGVMANAIGVVADRLQFYRLQNFIKLSERVEELLKARSGAGVRAFPTKFALPLIESATLSVGDR